MRCPCIDYDWSATGCGAVWPRIWMQRNKNPFRWARMRRMMSVLLCAALQPIRRTHLAKFRSHAQCTVVRSCRLKIRSGVQKSLHAEIYLPCASWSIVFIKWSFITRIAFIRSERELKATKKRISFWNIDFCLNSSGRWIVGFVQTGAKFTCDFRFQYERIHIGRKYVYAEGLLSITASAAKAYIYINHIRREI